MKLDSAEARALVRLMNTWDPHVVIDLHTTNGSYHGYHLTYAPTLNPNADARLIAFERDTLLPAVRKAMLDTHNFRTYYYGNFAPEGGGARESPRVDPQNSGHDDVAHVRSSASLRQQLRRPAQPHRHPVRGLQLSGLQGARGRDRRLRRRDLARCREAREADPHADDPGGSGCCPDRAESRRSRSSRGWSSRRARFPTRSRFWPAMCAKALNPAPARRCCR